MAAKELYMLVDVSQDCSFLYPVELLAGWISLGLVRFMLLALKRRVLWLEYGLKLKEPSTEDDHGHGL